MHENFGRSNYCKDHKSVCDNRPYDRLFIYYTDGVGKLFNDLAIDKADGID